MYKIKWNISALCNQKEAVTRFFYIFQYHNFTEIFWTIQFFSISGFLVLYKLYELLLLYSQLTLHNFSTIIIISTAKQINMPIIENVNRFPIKHWISNIPCKNIMQNKLCKWYTSCILNYANDIQAIVKNYFSLS